MVPQSIALPLPSASGANRTLVSASMIRSSGTLLTEPALGAVDDKPLFKYAITTSEVGYYVLPAFYSENAPTAAELSADYDVATLKGITHMVVFKEAVPGTRDVGSGFASMPAASYSNGGTAITIWGATVTNDIPFLVLDVLTGAVYSQDNTNTALDRLAFNDDDQAVNDFTFTLVSRILLSTDTDASTFQVNSSKVTREVTIFSNPVFADTAAATMPDNPSGDAKSLEVTLAQGEFVQRALGLDDIVFPADFPTTGLRVVRVSNTVARIYGVSGLTTLSGIKVASEAIVAKNGTPSITVASGLQFAIATVAPKAIVITSGTTLGATSGVAFQFTVTLTNDTFVTSGLNVEAGSGLDNSGIDLLTNSAANSGISLMIGNDQLVKASGLSLHAINVTPSVAGSSSVTFQLRGTTDEIPTTATELKITIGNLFLTNTTANVVVLTGNEAVSLTASPKLTIRFDDLS